MDHFSDMGRPSPRKELQGPRPTPLKVNKDSHKIKKPPVAPAAGAPSRAPPPEAALSQHRPPVIIYSVSPKVFRTTPSEFMSLVQSLTGASSSYSPSAATVGSSAISPSGSFSPGAGALSPAARLATIERAASAADATNSRSIGTAADDLMDQLLGFTAPAFASLDHRSGNFPSILSPLPTSIPPISPNFFSPSLTDPSALAFLNDMSPIFQGNSSSINRGFLENTFLPSPNLLSTSILPSPGTYWDLFNQL